jgi:hypothetical protein
MYEINTFIWRRDVRSKLLFCDYSKFKLHTVFCGRIKGLIVTSSLASSVSFVPSESKNKETESSQTPTYLDSGVQVMCVTLNK